MKKAISIHALLAESDGGSGVGSWPRVTFLSTLSLRRATHVILCPISAPYISIHALLAESDGFNPFKALIVLTFLSTLSLRRATGAECLRL